MSSPSQIPVLIPTLLMPFKSILDDTLTKYQRKTKKILLKYWLTTERLQRLMKCIRSSVSVLASISDTLGGGIGLAFPPAKVIFSEISVLLSVHILSVTLGDSFYSEF
ncbi:hypothetical protein EI94DRAFT_1802732 [Lactarius quietus]|nr:hypothetical protein EI94DRAFT_1802732 [Lactarius quietus]